MYDFPLNFSSFAFVSARRKTIYFLLSTDLFAVQTKKDITYNPKVSASEEAIFANGICRNIVPESGPLPILGC
jgi:hypothetical protein